MIDLHLHLDGSLTPETIIELAKREKTALPVYNAAELMKYLKAPLECADLNEYLTKFEIPLSVLQSTKALEYAVKELILRLCKEGLIYTEIRFAPQLHTRNGYSQEEIVKAAVSGMNKGIAECEGKINAQLILCCMRGNNNYSENIRTIELAEHYLKKGVAAIDLAGAEAIFKTDTFSRVFKYARELKVPFTIHAGEADGAESVMAALDFGASRIGHGIHSADSVKLLERLKSERIALETCPTSNVQTKAVKDISAHPVLKFLDMGLCVTVNTDNMTVSDTTIEKEYSILEKNLSMTAVQKRQLLLNSCEVAFVSEEERERLKSLVLLNSLI